MTRTVAKGREPAAGQGSKAIGRRERAAIANRFLGLVVDRDESKGVKDDPAAAALRRAKGFLESARYDEAFAPCDEAITLRPDWHEPHCIKGFLWRATGARAEAIASFNRSLDLARSDQPGRWLLYFWIAELCSELGLSDEACSACDRAEALHPDPVGRPEEIKTLADIRLGRKRRAVAKRRIAEAYYNVGCALGRTDQIAAALPFLCKARDLAPTAKMRRYAAIGIYHFNEQALQDNSTDDECREPSITTAQTPAAGISPQRPVVKSNSLGYTGDDPPPGSADTSQRKRMRDDFNIALKEARTETLARLVDLGNAALAPDERLRRARRLVRSYQRRKADNPEFQASREVREAFRIINSGQKPKASRSAKLAN